MRSVGVQAFVYLDPKSTGYITDLEKFAEAGFPESNELQPGSRWVWCRACSAVHFNGDACNLYDLNWIVIQAAAVVDKIG